MKQIPKLELNAEHELQQRAIIEQQFDDEILKCLLDAKKRNKLIRLKNNWIKNGRKLFYEIKKDIKE